MGDAVRVRCVAASKEDARIEFALIAVKGRAAKKQEHEPATHEPVIYDEKPAPRAQVRFSRLKEHKRQERRGKNAPHGKKSGGRKKRVTKHG